MNVKWVISGVLLLAALSSASAETIVWFTDGRSLTVESLLLIGNQAQLDLLGGSRIVVPAGRIERHQPYVRAVVAAPPPVALWSRLAGQYAEMIGHAARRHGVDPALLAAIAEAESGFDPSAVSHRGAQGLLQLMPATARRFGVQDSFDPAQNVEGAAQYLEWLLSRFSGNESLALAGYNAGEGAVDEHRGIPPYPETEHYVDRVLARVETLRASL